MVASRGLLDSLDEKFIIEQPVSTQREKRLLDNYLRERALTRTTEMLFRHANALKMAPPPVREHVRDFGFKAIVFKHSFIDGVNSLIVSAQDWAIGQEDFLLQYLEENLRREAPRQFEVSVERDATVILDALGEMTQTLRLRGASPSAYIISGTLGQSLYAALQQQTENPHDWYSRMCLAPRATHRFVGAHRGVPLVAVSSSPTPSIYVADLGRFATLTRYGDGESYEPEFHVDPFDDERAREVLARQPNLILDPPPRSGQEEERIRQLQLRVGLELWETYKLDVKDPGAVIARPLSDPVYE